MKRKIICVLLCMFMLMGILPVSGAAAGSITAGGWNETIWAKVTGVTDAQITAVSWAGTTSGSLTGEDLKYLVRDTDDCTRIDIPGIPAGTYTLTVKTTSGNLKKSGIVVDAQDRSGYAHYNYTAGVGAYNDDGSLKANAIVLYVTEENKNTVTVTSKDGTTVTGIGNILNSVGQDVGSGINSKGGKANTNSDILRKLAADGTPLVVRIIGTVTAPEGLTAYDSVDYGGSDGDNGYMARMSGGKDITIEGIGSGATIDGWGLHFICQTADYAKGYGKSFEVRNLTFRNVPEDCVGMEGQQEGSSLTAPVERCWIHNCAFYGPTISNPAESDKDGGDGACDFKRGQYFTNSYCYYEGYHKTNLVGSSDSSLQYNMTYHHNYWKDCESRGPLARQANIHMYNNIFEGQSSYCMSLRANAYIFSEYNLYLNSKQVTDGKTGGVCKSYNNSFTSSSGTDSSALIIVSDKSTTVSSNNKYANFDTKSDLSYIPSGKYILQEDLTEMKAVVLSQSGPQKQTLLSAADVNTSIIPSNRYPTAAVVLDYSKSLSSSYITSKSGIFDNIVFNVSKTGSDYISVGGSTSGCDIVFYVDTAVNVTISQHSDSANDVILCNAAGVCIMIGGGTAKDLPAGYYFIQSNNYDVGSGKYKEAKLASLTIKAVDPNAATTPIPDAPSGDNGGDTGSDSGSTGGNVTVVPGSYVHNFTESGLSSDFYSISGNLSTAKGSVMFDGLTLTQCLKIESSTSISFTAPEEGTLILVFGGSTSASGKNIKIDGSAQAIGSDSILSVNVAAGSHTITKKDSINLFYMVYTSKSAAESGTQEHAHSYTSAVTTAATCTAAGVMTYTCACGDSYAETIPAKGHSYASVTTNPTCTQRGTVVYTCDRCGDQYSESIAALGHSYGDWVVEKEATTTENGLRQKTCASCSDVISEILPMLDDGSGHVHDYTSEITTAPTCVSAGVVTYTCSCGASYTQSVDADSHDYTAETLAPTCTENGSVTYTCSLCGDTYTESILAMHSYTSQTVEPTCTEDGRITYTCSVCGDSYSEIISASGIHSFDAGVANDDGSVSFTCTVCGHIETEEGRPVEDPTETCTPDAETDPTDAAGGNVGEPEPNGTGWIIAVIAVAAAATVVVIVILKKKKNSEE